MASNNNNNNENKRNNVDKEKEKKKGGAYAVFTTSDKAVGVAMEEDEDALVCVGAHTWSEAMEEDGFAIVGSKPADEGEITMTEMYRRQLAYIEYHERQVREQRERQVELKERLARQAEQRERQAERFAAREKDRELEREKDRKAEREKSRRERERAKTALDEDVRASAAKRGTLKPHRPDDDDLKGVKLDLARSFAAAVAAPVPDFVAPTAPAEPEPQKEQQQQQQQQQQLEVREEKQQEQQQQQAAAAEEEEEEEEEEAEWNHTWELEAERLEQKSKKRGEISREAFVDRKDGDKLKHLVKVSKSDTTTAHRLLELGKELMPEVEFKGNSAKKIWTVRCVVESEDVAREVENLFKAYFGLEQTPF